MSRSNWQVLVKKYLIELCIRFKWLKKSSYSANELNQLLFADFPQDIHFPIPKGQGQLTLMQAELTLPTAQSHIHFSFLSSFTVDVLSNRIYQAHLTINVSASPYYSVQDSTLYMRDIKLNKVELISDEYALIKDTSNLLTKLMPSPVKGIISATLGTTLGLLNDSVIGELQQYLNIYIAGNKQRIIDYHQADLERAIIHYARQGKLEYKMDENDFEEALFARWGKQVKVENGQLDFILHPE